ncbi:MAG: DUF4159 domain-containing protein [Phycisphaeraceae bacterium]
MTQRPAFPFLTFVIGLLVFACCAQALTDEEVGEAIEKIKARFYQTQGADGSWEGAGGGHAAGRNIGGNTAIVVYALLTAGDSPQKPQLAKALAYLRQVEMEGTYAIGLRAHVWAHLPDAYTDLLKKDAEWLATTSEQHEFGLFDYTQHYNKRVDHSVTQYGVLGTWEAAKRNVRLVGPAWWENIANQFIKRQNDDGGWNYGGGDTPSYGSMTTSGLASLLVAQQESYRKSAVPNARITASIAKGLEWMDKNFKATENPGKGSWPYYYLYGVERVGLGLGWKKFKGQDWYKEGAEFIVRRVGANGAVGNASDTAFCLLFLARGRVPVWITKLATPGMPWNNRPNDIYFLTQYLSDYREGELNWQVLSIDEPLEDLRSTPMLYFASSQSMTLSDEQLIKLKQYIDLGGLLVANPDGNSQAFASAIRDFAQQHYPQYRFMQLPPKHPLVDAHYKLGANAGQIMTLNNGARDLILMPTRDYAMAWQQDEGEARNAPPWQFAANLFVMATDRGVIENRLVERIEKRQKDKEASGEMVMGRARYEGNCLPEPGAWETLANHVFNRAGLDLKVTAPGESAPAPRARAAAPKKEAAEEPKKDDPTQVVLELAGIGDSELKLIHVQGVDAHKLTDAQAEAVQAYVRRGGTLVFETVGGKGAFATDMEKQLTPLLGTAAVPLSSDHAIVTGAGLTGGHDAHVVHYRRYSVLNVTGSRRTPRLIAFHVNDRPAVILSQEDLSLGLLHVSHWGINGYQPQSAMNLFTNIVLWASQSKMGG